MEQDSSDFGESMDAGLRAHQAADYSAALAPRLAAYNAAIPGGLDAGRAARDLASTFDRISETAESKASPVSNAILSAAYAEHAYRIHQRIVASETPNADHLRELQASSFVNGIMVARQALHRRIRQQFQVPSATGVSKQALRVAALTHSDEAALFGGQLFHSYGRHHQYDVNASGRRAGLVGLWRSPSMGRELARQALSLADLSESDQLIDSPSLPPEGQHAAQLKARRRAQAAYLVGGLMTIRFLRPIANQLVDKVVL